MNKIKIFGVSFLLVLLAFGLWQDYRLIHWKPTHIYITTDTDGVWMSYDQKHWKKIDTGYIDFKVDTLHSQAR